MEGNEDVSSPCRWETLDSIRRGLILLNIEGNRVGLCNKVRIASNLDLEYE